MMGFLVGVCVGWLLGEMVGAAARGALRRRQYRRIKRVLLAAHNDEHAPIARAIDRVQHERNHS